MRDTCGLQIGAYKFRFGAQMERSDEIKFVEPQCEKQQLQNFLDFPKIQKISVTEILNK